MVIRPFLAGKTFTCNHHYQLVSLQTIIKARHLLSIQPDFSTEWRYQRKRSPAAREDPGAADSPG
jgi:hypothetical protein